MKARLIKLALSVLTSEKGRRTVGWILVAAFSPLILIIAFLCALGSGEAAHNNNMVEACFYGVEISDKAPQELKAHVREMRSAFSLLDSAVSAANAEMEEGNSLDPIRVKAVFLALCYGETAPSSRAANRFVDCFYTTEEATRTVEVEGEDGEITEEEESYVRAMPLPLRAAYGNVSSLLGREITEEDYDNISHIYRMIAGDMGDWEYDGDYSYLGGDYDVGWDLPPVAADPNKTAAGLVAYVTNAYESGWGYVWGTFGNVLTQSAFQSKLEQYPEGVGNRLRLPRHAGHRRQPDVLLGLRVRPHQHYPGDPRPRRLARRTHRRVHRPRRGDRGHGYPLRRGQNAACRSGMDPLAEDRLHQL